VKEDIRPAKMLTKVLALFLSALMMQHADSAGVFYTRWGRTTCSESAQLAYTGYMTTGAVDQKGSGSNYICVTSSPKSGPGNVPGRQEFSGALYPVQYDPRSDSGADGQPYSVDGKPFSWSNNNGKNLRGMNAPCAVCYIDSGASLMVPGTTDCPNDYNVEYWGYLVSAYWSTHYRTEFICMDNAPESGPGGTWTGTSAWVYPVQAECNQALPCPPYVNQDEITCVVCSV